MGKCGICREDNKNKDVRAEDRVDNKNHLYVHFKTYFTRETSLIHLHFLIELLIHPPISLTLSHYHPLFIPKRVWIRTRPTMLKKPSS